MMKKLFLLFAGFLFSCLVSTAFTQETVTESTDTTLPPSAQPPGLLPTPLYQPNAPALPRINPAMLLKMRNDLSFELQNIQRTLGLIDPSDAELKKTLTEQQAELVSQLKDINNQLKSQGIPSEVETGTLPPGLPALPQKSDTLMSSGQERIPSAIPNNPNRLLPQHLAPDTMGINPPGTQQRQGNPIQLPSVPNTAPNYTPPQPFDQDQAWGNSPWVPQPSKELTELKQTVESLRSEITGLKETVKALETQIQLLNRNILLSQPK